MDFSSNWSQPTDSNHQSQLQENGSIVSGHGLVLTHQLPPFPQNPNPNNHHHVATSSSNIPAARLAGSMAERARQARAPPPEGALKCPRCNSTNTKFCYYNNYNLTQPRHFCKACRRYWTQGGALRNVPVGGGCRRNNKKGKNVNSKTSSSSKQLASTVNAPSQSSGQVIRTNINHQFPFLPSLHNLTQLGGIGLNLAAATTTNGNNNNQVPHQIGSSLMNDLGFLRQNTSVSITGNNNNNNNNDNFSVFDPTTELYAYNQNENVGGLSFNNSSSSSMVDSRVYNHTTPVKMEEQPNLVNNLSKPGNHHQPNHQYYWNNSVFSGSSSDDHHHQQLL